MQQEQLELEQPWWVQLGMQGFQGQEQQQLGMKEFLGLELGTQEQPEQEQQWWDQLDRQEL